MQEQNPEARLWQAYFDDRSTEKKGALLLHYVDLVRIIVGRMMPVHGVANEYDDLISCGVLGLMDAIERFNPAREIKFETFASKRIRGEIIDHMRKQDWASSSLRRRINTINNAFERLEMENGKSPTEDEVASHLGMPVTEVRRALQKSHLFSLMHFEDFLTQQGAMSSVQSPLNHVGYHIEQQELQKSLAGCISTLKENERTVITLYYYEELTLKEIAAVLGVTESRVSQIHSKVLSKMKGQLKAELGEDAHAL